MTVDSHAHAMAVLAGAIVDLDNAIPAWLESMGDDPPAVAELLDDVRTARTRLHRIEAAVESTVARAMTSKTLELPDGRMVERLGGWSYREWDHARVAGRVAALAVVDTDTGEIGDEATAYRVRDLLVKAARMEWRTTQLRGLGVEYLDCCVREEGRRTVRISPKAGA